MIIYATSITHYSIKNHSHQSQLLLQLCGDVGLEALQVFEPLGSALGENFMDLLQGAHCG